MAVAFTTLDVLRGVSPRPEELNPEAEILEFLLAEFVLPLFYNGYAEFFDIAFSIAIM